MPMLAAAPDAQAGTTRLAADLAEVLEDLLDRTTQHTATRLQEHGLTIEDARVLRALSRSITPVHRDDLHELVDLRPAHVDRALAALRVAKLVKLTEGRVLATREGREVARDVERSHRAGLEDFVGRLEPRARLRLEAALHLVRGELSEQPAAQASGSASQSSQLSSRPGHRTSSNGQASFNQARTADSSSSSRPLPSSSERTQSATSASAPAFSGGSTYTHPSRRRSPGSSTP